ncbi:MAG: hypothetical protein Q9218_001889 [Villophora microphyllina]
MDNTTNRFPNYRNPKSTITSKLTGLVSNVNPIAGDSKISIKPRGLSQLSSSFAYKKPLAVQTSDRSSDGIGYQLDNRSFSSETSSEARKSEEESTSPENSRYGQHLSRTPVPGGPPLGAEPCSKADLVARSLSIRTPSQNQQQYRKPSIASSSTASSPIPSIKRKSNEVIELSSDDDDDVICTPKRRRSSNDSQIKKQTKTALSNVTASSGEPTVLPHIAIKVPLGQADSERRQFLKNLKALEGPPVTVVNNIDQSSPSLKFKFVKASILGPGVEKLSEDAMVGCQCNLNNGRDIGCEYLYRLGDDKSCSCTEHINLDGRGKKAFPYSAGSADRGCLRKLFLDTRHHIYECNVKCSCYTYCKNRKVQHGRQIPLEIFKTEDRGWGLRCPVDLQKGESIDTYRGEIITVDESNKRGDARNPDDENYLFSFDKFTEPVADGEPPSFKYVCDGMHVGGPTRFMNHSCEPNCRQFTASCNHYDIYIYDIAFFASEDIPAGTELTFDYKDEDDRSIITDQQALALKDEGGYMPQRCLCKADNCRRYFFN